MKMAILVKHHDHAYVERQVGWPLYTHLRGAGPRSEFRAEAIERSWRAYRRGIAVPVASAELGGLGLVVTQRALLAVEDLGRLLHAFGGADPWLRLRRAGIAEIDAAFTKATAEPETVLQTMGLITPAAITADELPEPARTVAHRLRDITAREWAGQIRRATGLWLTHRSLARATMHGFPVVAGDLMTEPPGAGEIADALVIPSVRPFAVAIMSTVADRQVTTDRHVVHLNSTSVRRVRDLGRAAARLFAELADMKAQCVRDGYRGAVPFRYAARLTKAERRVLDRAYRRNERGE